MSYVVTPNSFQAPLNQNPSNLFITQNIKDPVVQQNFEILNKQIIAQQQGKLRSKANYVSGPAFGTSAPIALTSTTALTIIPQLQVAITTYGNPVSIKLCPFSYSPTLINSPPGFYVGSFFTLSMLNQPAGSFGAVTVGWKRLDTSNGETTLLSASGLQMSVTPQVSVEKGLSITIPIPAFEVIDVVPAGLYIYQFYYQLVDIYSRILLYNLNATAYELG